MGKFRYQVSDLRTDEVMYADNGNELDTLVISMLSDGMLMADIGIFAEMVYEE